MRPAPPGLGPHARRAILPELPPAPRHDVLGLRAPGTVRDLHGHRQATVPALPAALNARFCTPVLRSSVDTRSVQIKAAPRALSADLMITSPRPSTGSRSPARTRRLSTMSVAVREKPDGASHRSLGAVT